MSRVSDRDIQRLDDLSADFTTMRVDADRIEIRDFVNGRLNKNARLRRVLGPVYQVRRAYYQLTKPEKVQAAKDILIRDKSTGAIYGGHQARALIGMPTGCEVRVRPGDHGNYDIFVLSTSHNRKLVANTDLLYKNS